MKSLREQHILTNDELVDIILKYVDKDIYNYAIMIDGEWGCGKTYFIKNQLIEEIEKHEKQSTVTTKGYKSRQVIYISLYGVKSIEEISKQVFMKSYLSKAENAQGITKAGIKVVGTVLPAVFDVINNKIGTDLNTDNISDSIEHLLPTKNSILIFDDLERCDCQINEILGYINSFVEQDGLKVILVANQKEIGRSIFQANQELKYLVAAHPNIMFSETSDNKVLQHYTTESNKDKQNENSPLPVDLNAIQNRMDRLFGQNTSYEQIKEKLVGQTIYYYPDLQAIFAKLITSSHLENNLQSILGTNLNFRFVDDFVVNSMLGAVHINGIVIK